MTLLHCHPLCLRILPLESQSLQQGVEVKCYWDNASQAMVATIWGKHKTLADHNESILKNIHCKN